MFGVRWDSGGNLKSQMLLQLLLVFSVLNLCNAYLVDSNPYRHVETLDGDGKYILEWAVDWERKRVIFNVTCETNGYVGFGLSRRGKMTGADIIIGGVTKNGKPYFSDRHAVGNQLPVQDESQDWTLHVAYEVGSHTFLSFSRPFVTCDKDDYPITEDVIGLIWSYGENDNFEEYHFQHRGHFDAFLLDPDLTPRIAQPGYRTQNPKEIGELKVWPITKVETLPVKDTIYSCTFHKAPRYQKKHHIVGFNTVLWSEVERKHIQSFTIFRCHPPAGRDSAAFFERYVRNRGQECYTHESHGGKIPTMNCREPIHMWSANGKAVFLPDHIGIPMSLAANEYYMIQAHFKNPEKIPGIRLRFALEIFYSSNVRKHDAGAMIIGQKTPASPGLLIPPSSLGHVIYGHCGTKCTKQMLPNTGIQVFAASMHTHAAGKSVRLQHIREKEELSWITFDDNYNYKFQQTRILRKERTVLPGDQLIMRCAYETPGKKSSTLGGLSMSHEICLAVIWYYNRIPGYGICDSEIKSDVYLGRLGITNATWSDEIQDLMVYSPKTFEGLTVTEVTTKHFKWTLAKRALLQADHRLLPQVNQCPTLIPGMKVVEKVVDASDETSHPPSLQRFNLNKEKEKEKEKDVKEKEIILIDSEYTSIYGKDVEEYFRPPLCERQIPKQIVQEDPNNQYQNNPLITGQAPRGTFWAINSNPQGYNGE